MLYVYLGTAFIAVCLLTSYLVLASRYVRNPAQKRMEELTIPEEQHSKRKRTKREAPRLSETGKKLLVRLGTVTRLNEGTRSKLQERLALAGYRQEEHSKVFAGVQTAAALIGAGLTLYLGLSGHHPAGKIVLMSFLMALAGHKMPDVLLNSKIRKRQLEIGEELPDALDLLVITVEAGLGLNAAIMKVGQDLRLRSPSIAEEFTKVNQDLRTGIPREEALRDLGQRNQVEDLKIFVGALILADRLGTSIADTLRIQADSLRTRIRQKAQEKAAKAAVKMLIPLVLFILPALIMILMGPGLISVVRTLSN
ncbi:type II secretion system F family protein [bacterium]|nr:type II secretion system F family protein [bacterium]